jgi:AcrR family transcriptional regulator
METRSGRQLSPEDWLDAAFSAFSKGGVDAVRVEALARSLQVTRGSFYWHFKDRGALLMALLDRWRRDETALIIDAVEAAGGPAEARLLKLLETCARNDGHLELALRTWAATDQAARDAVVRADLERREYLTTLLVEHGMDTATAADRARLAYAAWLGEYLQHAVPVLEERLESMRALHRMVLTAP